jgi:hypothetical protein
MDLRADRSAGADSFGALTPPSRPSFICEKTRLRVALRKQWQ